MKIPLGICREGEETYFQRADPPAQGPGHVYSEAGRREFWISGYCEYHFDEITAEPDDPDEQAQAAAWFDAQEQD